MPAFIAAPCSPARLRRCAAAPRAPLQATPPPPPAWRTVRAARPRRVPLASAASDAPPPPPASASASASSPAVTAATPARPPSARLAVLREYLHGFAYLARPLWTDRRRAPPILWTSATLLLAAAAAGYTLLLSTIQKLFWNVLAAKDISKFPRVLTWYAVAVTVGPVVAALFAWVKDRLALLWRERLTARLVERYLADRNYYKISLRGAEIDNPDQRIAEDVSRFTTRAVRIITVIGVAVFDLLIFSVVLHSIYAPLLYTLIVYAAVGTALIVWTGRNLLELNREQVAREANLRYALVRLRETVESVAFYRGEKAESEQLLSRLLASITNNIRLLALRLRVDFFSSSFRYWAQVVPTMVIAPRYFAGKAQLGTMSQVYFSFNHVLSSLGLVSQEFAALSEFAAGIRRLTTLSDALEEGSGDEGEGISNVERDDGDASARLRFEDVTVLTPGASAAAVVKRLSLEVEPGERVLVIGTSGVGKSSLMRAACGLWTAGSGVVERPATQHTLFLPQRPFLMLGSLRDNAVYPSNGRDVTDEQVVQALRDVNLGYLIDAVGGLDADGEMLTARLSLGEQQRLAFARVVLSRPKLVVLDESTSALDLANEAALYQLVERMRVTCVSVGNRPSLLAFHSRVLRLSAGGDWTLLTPDDVLKEQRESLHI